MMKILRRIVGLGPSSLGRDPAINLDCSEFEVNNWVISEFILEKLVPLVGTHPFPINELCLMVSAVCRLKPTHLFEWGTHIGKSARIFYETAKHFGLATEIHSIDLPDEIDREEHSGVQRGILVKGLSEVKLYQGDGLTKSIKIYRMLPKTSKPMFFIDGDHSYESVKRELNEILQNIPEANILLHDTFYQSAGSGYNIGPYKAIADMLATVPNNYRVISTSTGLPGMTLLYRL